MKIFSILFILSLPISLFSQNFPSFQKVKSDLITNKIMNKSDIGYLEQTEYPWELGIVKLYNRKTQDSVIPEYFNKASRILKYNLPPRFSMNECSITVTYVKTKPNDSWKYFTTISEGCPKESIQTQNLTKEISENSQRLKTSFLQSFLQKPSDWSEIEALVGIDKNSISISELYGKKMLTYTIEYTVIYSQSGKFTQKTFTTSARLFNDKFTPKGNVEKKNEQTLNELPASIERIKP